MARNPSYLREVQDKLYARKAGMGKVARNPSYLLWVKNKLYT